MEPTFCNCNAYRKVRMKQKYPEYKYCKEHHNPRVCCPEYAQYLGDKAFDRISPHLLCPHCGRKHDPRVKCVEFFKGKKGKKKIPRLGPALPSDFKDDCEYFIDVANGKYSVYLKKNGEFKALRYSTDWQDLCGNNLVHYMMVELIEAQEKIRHALEAIDSLDWNKGFLINILEGKNE